MTNDALPATPKNRGIGLALRLLFWMSVTALVPLLVVFWQVYRDSRQTVTTLQDEHLHAIAAMKVALLREWLGEIRSETLLVAADACVQGCALAGSAAGPENQLRRGCSRRIDVTLRDPGVRSIVLYNAEGATTAGSSRSGFSPPSPTAFLDLLAKQPVPFQAQVAPGGLFPATLLAGSPIRSAEGELLGFVVTEIDLSLAVGRILAGREGLGHTGRAALLASDGAPLAVSPGAKPSDFRHAPEGPQTARTAVDDRGVAWLGVSTPISPENWVLRVEIGESEALALLDTLSRRALVTLAITLVLVLVLALHLSRRLSRPLKRLAQTARQVIAGRLEARVETPLGIPEADAVATTFNRMMDAVQVAQGRLVHAAALAAVGELSSSIVHEIRNPLSTIKMNLEAFQGSLSADPVASELCEIAQGQAARIERMLTDLLGFVKPLELHLESVCFEELVGRVRRAVAPLVLERGVQWETVDKTDRQTFQADSELLERMLVNLVRNAAQAVGEGGRVRLEADREAGQVVLRVTDDGPGIAPAVLSHLFRPFCSTRPDGTGLGLANVRRIAEYHGGDVSAENLPGRGACFTVRLPQNGSKGIEHENPDH